MRHALVLLSLALFAAGPALASGKTTGKKPGDKGAVCDSLVEKRLELSRELDLIDSRVAEKNRAINALAETDAELPAVDMTGTEEVVDLTAPDEKTAAHQQKISKIVSLQAEIATLDESRLDVERRAARVKSTLSQSCPK